MDEDSIEQFMWGFQPHFAAAVKLETDKLLRAMGCTQEAEVFLVGFAQNPDADNAICIEPEKKVYFPDQFRGVSDRAAQLYETHPRHDIVHFDGDVHNSVQAKLRDWARSEAVREVLEQEHPTDSRAFFVGRSVAVEAYEVHTAIGVPKDLVEIVPTLKTEFVNRDITVTRSLLSAAMDQLLSSVFRALHLPEPGRALIGTFERSPEEMLRSAGDELVTSAVRVSGELLAGDVYSAVKEISTMRYEKRSGLGRMTIVPPHHPSVQIALSLVHPVDLTEHRQIRKLLEISEARGLSLLMNGQQVYAAGTFEQTDDTAEDAFDLTIEGDGAWDLRRRGQSLMHVEYGVPMLPKIPLRKSDFVDLADRILGPECDVDTLWAMAEAASSAEHGTMLVISAGAVAESARLASQAIGISPSAISADTMKRVTGIDGAVLVGTDGLAHAIGVILDGTASERVGDASRGARLNSALRYLKSTKYRTVIVLVSEDGMIDLLPALRPRIHRRDMVQLIDTLKRLTAGDDEQVRRREFYRTYSSLTKLAFYLSPELCEEINALRQRVDSIPPSAWNEVRLVYRDLKPNPEMTDEYFVQSN